MQDLGLRDYALIEGFVQLPFMGPPKREKPEELEHYEPPNVHQLAHRLRKNDNSDLVPPWDPPKEEAPSEQFMEAYSKLVDDPEFKDMGPYTDPKVAELYHSDDVVLRHIHTQGHALEQRLDLHYNCCSVLDILIAHHTKDAPDVGF